MPHKSQLKFVETVKSIFPEWFSGKRILEIGSAGSAQVRDFFDGCKYIGIDVSSGVNVTQVCSGHEFSGEGEGFDLVLSCECFEHNPFWLETFINMIRLCRPSGLVVFTCASTARAEHGTVRSGPHASASTGIGWNYYKNLTMSDFGRRIDLDLHFSRWRFFENYWDQDLYFIGLKRNKTNPVKYIVGVDPRDDVAEDFIERFDRLSDRVRDIISFRNTALARRFLIAGKHILRWFCLTEKNFQGLLIFMRRLGKEQY